MALALTLIVAGCATAPNETAVEPLTNPTPDAVDNNSRQLAPPPPAEAPVKAEAPALAQTDSATTLDKQPEAVSEMVTVSVYTVDDQCDAFVEESVQVPSDKAMTEAVGKAMGAVDYNAFKLAAYEVSLSGTTAIVDMTLAPGSERQFVSLSSCEQRALFGSVEQTLLGNAEWNVTAVKFTDSGKDLVL